MSIGKYIFFVFCVLIAASCKKENQRPQWDIGVLGPMVKGSLTINNLVNDTLLKTNTDRSLSLVYERSLYSLNIDSLVTIPDTNIVNSFSYTFPIRLTAGFPFKDTTSEIKLSVSNVQLRYAIIKSGQTVITATNKLPTKVFFSYIIPKATLNGNPYTLSTSVAAADINGSKTTTSVVDLSGYHLDLSGQTGSKVNSLAYKILAYTDSAGQAVTVTANDTFLLIYNTLKSIKPSYVKGYLGQSTINVSTDSSSINLFKSIKSGTLDLEAANVNLSIENDIGVDAQVTINSLASINSGRSSTVSLVSSRLNTALNINRASSTGTNDAPGYIPSFYTLQFDNSNSNFKMLIDNLPDLFTFGLKIETNPLGNVSGDNDFAFADHLINASLRLEVPFNFSANQLILSDTADFTLSGDSILTNIGAGSLLFNVDNGFPFSFTIKLVTLDMQNNLSDVLLSNANAATPPLDVNLYAVGKQRSQFVIPLDEARVERLRNAKKMIVTAAITTAAGLQHVKIYSNYSINYKLIGDVTYHVR